MRNRRLFCHGINKLGFLYINVNRITVEVKTVFVHFHFHVSDRHQHRHHHHDLESSSAISLWTLCDLRSMMTESHLKNQNPKSSNLAFTKILPSVLALGVAALSIFFREKSHFPRDSIRGLIRAKRHGVTYMLWSNSR